MIICQVINEAEFIRLIDSLLLNNPAAKFHVYSGREHYKFTNI